MLDLCLTPSPALGVGVVVEVQLVVAVAAAAEQVASAEPVVAGGEEEVDAVGLDSPLVTPETAVGDSWYHQVLGQYFSSDPNSCPSPETLHPSLRPVSLADSYSSFVRRDFLSSPDTYASTIPRSLSRRPYFLC